MPDYRSVGYILAFALFGSGLALVVVLSVWNKIRSSEQRTRLQLLGFFLLGSGMLVLAAINLCAIYTSKLITVQGSVQHLYQSHGKSHSSSFSLRNQGVTQSLSTDYDGRQLYNGQQVLATFLSDTGTVTDLRVLDGANVGWTLHEGSGVATSLFEICLSSLFIFIGFPRQWLKKTKPAARRARTINSEN
jgi:hypothetical protein